MNIRFFTILQLTLIVNACSNDTIKIKNDRQGTLKSSIKLEIIDQKKFMLDSTTAPKVQYMEIIEGKNNNRIFTFSNEFTNSIYFYDYETQKFIKKLSFKKKGNNAVYCIKGYYIKSKDSIYIYNKPLTELVLADYNGKVINRISLRGNKLDKKWYLNYPQYVPLTVNPLIVIKDELLLTGQYIQSIPKSIIDKFRFTARININTQDVKFNYLYPNELYGFDYNWQGRLFTEVFMELHPDGDKLIFSFPVSHNLYIADLNSEKYHKIYAGGNETKTICSINMNTDKTDDKMACSHFMHQDTYAAIKYDKYRNVYYRFLLNAIPGATIQNGWKEKSVTIIIMDKNFNYLGETFIGTGEKEWYWQNSFVTKEGLNIEYIDKNNEDNLILKIFTIKNL
jgi:hypothetical protein